MFVISSLHHLYFNISSHSRPPCIHTYIHTYTWGSGGMVCVFMCMCKCTDVLVYVLCCRAGLGRRHRQWRSGHQSTGKLHQRRQQWYDVSDAFLFHFLSCFGPYCSLTYLRLGLIYWPASGWQYVGQLHLKLQTLRYKHLNLLCGLWKFGKECFEVMYEYRNNVIWRK